MKKELSGRQPNLRRLHGGIRMGGKPSKTSQPDKLLVSVVTVCLNSEKYLEQTIQSVINQTYDNIEYIIIDGGSTDKTLDIIRKYENRITRWISEPDKGMYDALNKGFADSTGEIMAWLNSDDMLTPWALSTAVDIFQSLPGVEWITSLFPIQWDAQNRAISCSKLEGFNRDAFLRGRNLPGYNFFGKSWIQQESTFWKRTLWEKAGGYVNSSLDLAGDFELWMRFFERSNLFGVPVPLGGFRCHPDQKTRAQMDVYLKEAEKILRSRGRNVFSLIEIFLTSLALLLPKKTRRPFRFLSYQTKIVRYNYKESKWVISNNYLWFHEVNNLIFLNLYRCFPEVLKDKYRACKKKFRACRERRS